MEKTIVWLPTGELIPAEHLTEKYLATIMMPTLYFNLSFK